MVIGIIARDAEVMKSAGKSVYNIVKENNGECVFLKDSYTFDGIKELSENEFFNTVNIIIVLGGDGTLIKYAVQASEHDIPVLGINYGRIGLLMDMEKSDMPNISKIFTGEYVIDERMMINATLCDNGIKTEEFTALNEIVVSRGASPKMLDLSLYIDGALSTDIRADGVVLSTPTGSTAYSLSAGGSVIDPSAKLIAFTPICPHTLKSRPLIIGSNRNVTLKHTDKTGVSYLSCDGQEIIPVKGSCDINIKISENTVKLIRIKNRDFYSVLREKL